MIYVTHDQTEVMSMGDRLVVLRDGMVQQVGTPLEIYNIPTNQFVAGFVGSPPMNFITCDVRRAGGEGHGNTLRLVNESFDLSLDENHRAALDRQLDRTKSGQIVLGIRSEDIHERDTAHANTPGDDGFVKAQVMFIEPLGSEVLATCALGKNEIVARLSPRTSARADSNPRVVSRFGNDSPPPRIASAKLLAMMLLTLKGTPFIYQGDELGMTN